MESQVRKDVEVTIVMSEEEARWLMLYLQNGLPTEGTLDAEMRRMFFETIKRDIGYGPE